MPSQISKTKDLKSGDLVTHLLYGKEWIGLIVEFKDPPGQRNLNKEKALIQIQPGTKFDGFFLDKAHVMNRVHKNLGYVSVNWLFKIEVENEKPGPSRGKT